MEKLTIKESFSWSTGARTAPPHPRPSASLRGELRPRQRRPRVCVRQSRSTIRAEERTGGCESKRCRDEGASQNLQ